MGKQGENAATLTAMTFVFNQLESFEGIKRGRKVLINSYPGVAGITEGSGG